MDRESPSRRPSALAVAIVGIGVCAAFGVLIGVSLFGSSSAAGLLESPGADTPTLAAPITGTASTETPIGPIADSVGVAASNAGEPEIISAIPADSVAPEVLGAPEAPEMEIENQAEIERAASAEISGADSPRVTEGVLGRGDTLARSLAAQGVSARVIDQIARAMIGHYDFRHSQPGHAYELVQNAEGEIESFHYEISPIVGYELSRSTDGGYEVARDETELWPRETMIAGIVTSSLYGAITDLGGAPQLANDFTEVFAYDVDFSRSIRAGDEFRILYEQLYRTLPDGEEVSVRPGRILAARYAGASGEHTAVYFETEKGRGGYYRPDGSTVQREFLMAPVSYARISSRYSTARFHPILKITRPHQGIDYAAAIGTPVFAVASGEVIYGSRAGGFGNLVKIRHDNGYVTYYGHLSRFADGLHVGQRVSQKQVIGYVGSTGLSTGPHVCFRVAKDGKYVNPIQMPTPARLPLPEKLTTMFQARRDTLLASLDSGRLVAADEAL